MRKTLFAAVAAAFCTTMAATTAQALTVTEPPDLSNTLSSATDLGTLDLGLNSVFGTLTQNCILDEFDLCRNVFEGDEGDAFRVDIAAGTELISAILNVTSLGTFASVSTQAISPGALNDPNTFSMTGAFDLLSGVSPLTGSFEFASFLSPGLFQSSSRADWRVDLTVAAIPSAVPLPAGMPLLLVGLGGFAVLRKRKTA